MRASQNGRAIIHGYKVTQVGGFALNDFRFVPNTTYKHEGEVVKMCSSGFHFSIDPLQALGYATSAYKTDNLQLYPVTAIGKDTIVGHDKIVTDEIVIGEASLFPHTVECYSCWCLRISGNQRQGKRRFTDRHRNFRNPR